MALANIIAEGRRANPDPQCRVYGRLTIPKPLRGMSGCLRTDRARTRETPNTLLHLLGLVKKKIKQNFVTRENPRKSTKNAFRHPLRMSVISRRFRLKSNLENAIRGHMSKPTATPQDTTAIGFSRNARTKSERRATCLRSRVSRNRFCGYSPYRSRGIVMENWRNAIERAERQQRANEITTLARVCAVIPTKPQNREEQ